MKIKDYSILVPIRLDYDLDYDWDDNSQKSKVYFLDYVKQKIYHLDGTEITGDFKNEVFNYINKSKKPVEVPEAPNNGWNLKA